MKKYLIKTLAITCIILHSFTASSQEQQKKIAHRYLGLGIRASGIQIGDFNSNAYPTNRLILSLDPHPYFRIESQLGFFNKKSEETSAYYSGGSNPTKVKLELNDRSTFIGFGLMGLHPIEQGRFITGLRYSMNNYILSRVYVYPNGFPSSVENKGRMTLISGVIGGEYFFAKFFSIGAEFSISSIKDTYEPNSVFVADPTTNKTLLTEGNLIFKFYPF